MLRLGLMMTVLTAIFVILGYVIGLFLGSPELVSLGALVLAGIMNLVSYLYSDKIVLSMSRAKVVSETEYPDLHRMVAS
ncbi:MAG: hypothetical protein QXG08_02815, partial [Candidatus Methanomethyliaceae archaeon]